MVEMVNARRGAEIKEERHDMFSNLLDAAHDNPDGSVSITEDELVGKCRLANRITLLSLAFPGNMFILLLAGHEVRYHIPPVGNLNFSFPTDVSTCTLLRVCITSPLSR